MFRRAVMLAAVLTAVAVPAAQARPSIVVEATAVGVIADFEQMNVAFECAAHDVLGRTTYLSRCSFGPIYADTGGCFECYNPPVASGGGTLPFGLPYDLCVTATSSSAAGTQTVARCAPYSYLTNTAVVAG